MVELIRLVAQALNSGEYGVNKQLTTLPIHSRKDLRPRDITKVLSVVDDVLTAEEQLDWPIILVSIQNPIESGNQLDSGGPVAVFLDFPEAEVVIDLVTSAEDQQMNTRESLQVLRAIIRCLHDLMVTTNDTTDAAGNGPQVEDGICLIALNKVTYGPVELEIPSGRIVGSVIAEFHMRDQLV